MPELPEADASRRAVEAECLNRIIEDAVLGPDTEHMDLPGANERARLAGHQFTQARRHGKLIFAGSKTGPWIAVHLGMTGRLIPFDAPEDPPDYAKFVIRFEGDRRLAFRNTRKFGWLRVIDDPDVFIEEAEGYGPDALDISRNDFADKIGSTRGAVKSALIAQKKLAGIGNLWSDEILFQTGIHPDTRANSLDEDQLGEVYETMRRVLNGVCDVNAHYSELPGDWLIADRNEGAECPRCGGTIARKTVGGRSAYFCGDHQT